MLLLVLGASVLLAVIFPFVVLLHVSALLIAVRHASGCLLALLSYILFVLPCFECMLFTSLLLLLFYETSPFPFRHVSFSMILFHTRTFSLFPYALLNVLWLLEYIVHMPQRAQQTQHFKKNAPIYTRNSKRWVRCAGH